MTTKIHRGLAAAGAGILLGIAAVAVPATAQAVDAGCTGDSTGRIDFDADAIPDTVVAIPDRVIGGQAEAGAVIVQQSRAGTVELTRTGLGLGDPVAGDRFGEVVRPLGAGLLGTGSCAALLVTAPGWDETGTAFLLRGSADGINGGPALTRIAPVLTPFDAFGAAAGDFHVTSDGIQISLGAPGTDIDDGPDGDVKEVGAVHRIKVDADTPTLLSQSTVWNLDSPGVPLTAKKNDRFGTVISGHETVGVPKKDIGKKEDVGAVVVGYGTGETPDNRVIRQGKGGVPGTAEAGDRFGASVNAQQTCLGGCVIGIPGEDVNGVRNTGSVAIALTDGKNDSVFTWRGIHQATKGVAGKAERGDRFGEAASRDFSGFSVGAPGEDVKKKSDAGAVTLLRRITKKNVDSSIYTQAQSRVTGKAEADDRFGDRIFAIGYWSSETTGPSTSGVVIGSPGEDGTGPDSGALWAGNWGRQSLTTKVSPLAGDQLGTGPVVDARDAVPQ
jgi:hypothetical protein